MNCTDYFTWSVRAQTIASAMRQGPLVDEPLQHAQEIIEAIQPGAVGVFAVEMRAVWLSLWTLLSAVDDAEYLRSAITDDSATRGLKCPHKKFHRDSNKNR